MATYSEKLKDPRWQKKRLEILSRDNWKCSICENSERTLHVHHMAYNGNPWDAKNEQLTTYCEYCHLAVESYKKQGLKVLQTELRIINARIYFLEIYTISKDGIYAVSISLYEDNELVYNSMVLESGLKRHINRINRLKNQNK
jgi:hypothetical protein